MKTYVTFGGLSRDGMGPENYAHLEELCPEGAGPHMFGRKPLPLEDAGVQAVLDFLGRWGMLPATGFPPVLPNSFGLTLTRRYDPEDFLDVSYVTFHPRANLDVGALRSDDNRLQLLGSRVRPIKAIATDFRANLVVSEAMKQRLAAQGFAHVTLRDVLLFDRKGNVLQTPIRGVTSLTPYWELGSDLLLPRMSPKMALVTDEGKPFEGDYSKGCLPREGMSVPDVLYLPPELHYRATDLATAEPFDLAQTQEQFGRINVRSRSWVASKRFYDFCIGQGLDIEWQPVRIDD